MTVMLTPILKALPVIDGVRVRIAGGAAPSNTHWAPFVSLMNSRVCGLLKAQRMTVPWTTSSRERSNIEKLWWASAAIATVTASAAAITNESFFIEYVSFIFDIGLAKRVLETKAAILWIP